MWIPKETAAEDLCTEVAELRKWKETILDEAVCCEIWTPEHETDPKKCINDIICWYQQVCLDPAVSIQAALSRDTYKPWWRKQLDWWRHRR